MVLFVLICLGIIAVAIFKDNDKSQDNDVTVQEDVSPPNYRLTSSGMGADGFPCDCCYRCEYAQFIPESKYMYCSAYCCYAEKVCICDDFSDGAIAMIVKAQLNKK